MATSEEIRKQAAQRALTKESIDNPYTSQGELADDERAFESMRTYPMASESDLRMRAASNALAQQHPDLESFEASGGDVDELPLGFVDVPKTPYEYADDDFDMRVASSPIGGETPEQAAKTIADARDKYYDAAGGPADPRGGILSTPEQKIIFDNYPIITDEIEEPEGDRRYWESAQRSGIERLLRAEKTGALTLDPDFKARAIRSLNAIYAREKFQIENDPYHHGDKFRSKEEVLGNMAQRDLTDLKELIREKEKEEFMRRAAERGETGKPYREEGRVKEEK